MKKYVYLLLIITAFSLHKTSFAQTPALGSLVNFLFFTGAGAISNTGNSNLTGNIGTGGGAVTGFTLPSHLNGVIHNTDATTLQANNDLTALYNQLISVAATNVNHTQVFGSGETLVKGVYKITTAGSVSGNIILDAQSDSNAIFIFQFAGALTFEASSSITLVNGTSPCNVFWVAGGAISSAAKSSLKGTFVAHAGAISLGNSCYLEGRMFSTTGAISLYAEKTSVPLSCTGTTIWTGAAGTAKWFDPNNWSSNIPSLFTKVVIPASVGNGNSFPVLDSSIASLDSLIILSGSTFTITNSTLQILGGINNAGVLDATNGTVEIAGTTQQTIPENLFLNNTVLNLVISNNVIISHPQNITGTLSFGGSGFTLNTGNLVTLKSTSLGTARLADITNGGADSGNVIIGNMGIERYIPAKRSWRLLSAPISTTSAPTINAAWQEGTGGGVASLLTTGFGTQITGGTKANGFDQGINGNSSIKVFVNNAMVALPAVPGTNIPITNYPGYFLFIRGGKNTNLSQGASAVTSNTTLRVTGHPNTGSLNSTINAAGLTLVGNPYPSPINFHSLSKNNVNDKFYVWDPKIGGASGYGSYVTVSWNAGISQYDIIPSSSLESQYIASGAAFFTESLDGENSGTLTIKETDKNVGVSDNVFRVMSVQGKLKADIFGFNADSSLSLIDGVMTTFDDISSNAVDRQDSKKLYNLAEVIAIDRDNSMLSIERRHTILNNDTSFINLYRLKQKTYRLQLSALTPDGGGLSAIIKDSYSAFTNNTPVNLNGITNINFKVNADSGSFAPNRFNIVFVRKIPAIVSFTGVRAFRHEKDIIVEWTNTTEREVKNYQVEELSIKGNIAAQNSIDYVIVSTIPAKSLTPGTESYSWIDPSVTTGTHYYRIKSVSMEGKVSNSEIVQITINPEGIAGPAVVVNGNIVQGRNISLRFYNITNGVYQINLYSMQGQLIKKLDLMYTGGPYSLYNFTLDRDLTVGKYQLFLTGKSIHISAPVIKQL